MTERELQDALTDLARLCGWLVCHPFDSRRSEPGFPDLVLVHAGARRVIFAELKSERGRVTVEQTHWMSALIAAGAEVYLWRPSDYDAAIALLKMPRRVEVGL